MATIVEKEKDPKALLADVEEFKKVPWSNLTKAYTDYRLKLLALHESGLKLAEMMNALAKAMPSNFYSTEFAVRAIDFESIEKARRNYSDKTWDNTVLPLNKKTEEKGGGILTEIGAVEKKLKSASTLIQNQMKKEKTETTKRLKKERDNQLINMANSELEKKLNSLNLQQKALFGYWRNFKDREILNVLQLVTEGLNAEMDFYREGFNIYQPQGWLAVTTVHPPDWPEPNFNSTTVFEGLTEENLGLLTAPPVRSAAPVTTSHGPISGGSHPSSFTPATYTPSTGSSTTISPPATLRPPITATAIPSANPTPQATNPTTPPEISPRPVVNTASKPTFKPSWKSTKSIGNEPPKSNVMLGNPTVTTEPPKERPEDWEEFATEGGTKYYYSKRENRSTWTPKALNEKQLQELKNSPVIGESTPAKGKWVEVFSPEGLPYWYNEETDESVWEKPE